MRDVSSSGAKVIYVSISEEMRINLPAGGISCTSCPGGILQQAILVYENDRFSDRR